MKKNCNMCGSEERLDGEYFCEACARKHIVPYLDISMPMPGRLFRVLEIVSKYKQLV